MNTMDDESSSDAHKRRVPNFFPLTAILPEEPNSWNG